MPYSLTFKVGLLIFAGIVVIFALAGSGQAFIGVYPVSVSYPTGAVPTLTTSTVQTSTSTVTVTNTTMLTPVSTTSSSSLATTTLRTDFSTSLTTISGTIYTVWYPPNCGRVCQLAVESVPLYKLGSNFDLSVIGIRYQVSVALVLALILSIYMIWVGRPQRIQG